MTELTQLTVVDGNGVLRLGSNLNIAASQQLYGEVEKALQQPLGELAIDGSSVENADTTALQVLAVLLKELSAAGCSDFHWQGTSQPLLELVELGGLSRELNLGEVPG